MIKITNATLHDLKRIQQGIAMLEFQCEKTIAEARGTRKVLKLFKGEMDQFFKDVSKELK